VDLESQTVTTPFQDRFTFEIDPFRKHCLIGGLDEVGLTLQQDEAIARHEAARTEALAFMDRPSRAAAA